MIVKQNNFVVNARTGESRFDKPVLLDQVILI